MNNLYSHFEHQTLHASDFQFLTDFEWLLGKVESGDLPCFAITLKSRQPVLIVQHYLAVIRLPSGDSLELLPKVSQTANVQGTRTWVARMLSDVYAYTHESKGTRPLPVLSQRDNAHQTELEHDAFYDSDPNYWQTWLSPIIQQWCDLLMAVIQRLPRHYQTQSYNHPQAQGKLLIKEQLRHNHHRPHYRYTQQQQMQWNPLWDKVFLTTAMHIHRLGMNIASVVMRTIQQGLQQGLKKGLYGEAVGDTTRANTQLLIPPERWLSSLQQLRQQLTTSQQLDYPTKHQLDLLLSLTELILKMQDMPPATFGTHTVPAVMVNMHYMFEAWVSQWIHQHHTGNVQTQAHIAWLSYRTSDQATSQHSTQHPLLHPAQDPEQYLKQQTVDNTKYRYIKPDVLIYQASIDSENNIITDDVRSGVGTGVSSDKRSVQVVADIKYKTIHSPADIASSDLYQMLAYQRQLGAKRVWLIYPESEQFNQPYRLHIHSHTHTVHRHATTNLDHQVDSHTDNGVSNDLDNIADEANELEQIVIEALPFSLIEGCLRL